MPKREDFLKWGRGENVHGLPTHFPPDLERNFPKKPEEWKRLPLPRAAKPDEWWDMGTLAHLGRVASSIPFPKPEALPLRALIVDDVPDGTYEHDWICGECKFHHFGISYHPAEGETRMIARKEHDEMPETFRLWKMEYSDVPKGRIERFRVFFPYRMFDGDVLRCDRFLLDHLLDFSREHGVVQIVDWRDADRTTRPDACKRCAGVGSIETSPSAEGWATAPADDWATRRSCDDCKGTGLSDTCSLCSGTGTVAAPHSGFSAPEPEACGECGGSGRISKFWEEVAKFTVADPAVIIGFDPAEPGGDLTSYTIVTVKSSAPILVAGKTFRPGDRVRVPTEEAKRIHVVAEASGVLCDVKPLALVEKPVKGFWGGILPDLRKK